jgi:hypothetical protein
MRRIGLLVLLATVLPGCAAPVPSPTASPVPSPSPSQLSTERGTIVIACEVPVVPGHCLQPLAWAIGQLPTARAEVATVAIRIINPCPDASPCMGLPHRYDWWAAITLRDGTGIGMWVVNLLGVDRLQSVGTDATPPPSAEPATGAFQLSCGDIQDVTCAGAAAGSTSIGPNKPPHSIEVKRGPASDHYLVTLNFEDGTQVTAEVAPDLISEIGWSAIGSPAP